MSYITGSQYILNCESDFVVFLARKMENLYNKLCYIVLGDSNIVWHSK